NRRAPLRARVRAMIRPRRVSLAARSHVTRNLRAPPRFDLITREVALSRHEARPTACPALVTVVVPAAFAAVTSQAYSPLALALIELAWAPGTGIPFRVHE